MNPSPAQVKPTELDQAAADRRTFGNATLAANAELKVIAEALRELVTELRLIRAQFDKLVGTASHDEVVTALHAGGASAATRIGVK
jgi:hypothetical protein